MAMNSCFQKYFWCPKIKSNFLVRSGLFFSVCFALSTSLQATTRVVPDQYPSIQSAINASSDGDTVFVKFGVYNESIAFNGKNIHLLGEENPDHSQENPESAPYTVIDATDLDTSVITIDDGEDSSLLLEKLVIQGGEGQVSSGRKIGGGIRVQSAGFTGRDLVIRNNRATTGAGIFITGSLVFLSDSVITGNEARLIIHNGGGGVHSHTSTLIIQNTKIIENQALDTYGAGLAQYSGTAVMMNSIVANNEGDLGAGIFSNAGRLELHNSAILNNLSTYTGAGVTTQNAVELTGGNNILYNNINENQTSFRPGEIAMLTPELVEISMANSIFTPGSHAPDTPFLINPFFAEPQFVSNDPHSIDFAKLLPNTVGHNDGHLDSLPFDWFDVDGDGDYYEDLPIDLLYRPRIFDGQVDIGPFELQVERNGENEVFCDADLDQDGAIGNSDILVLLTNWDQVCDACPSDINNDGFVNYSDLLEILTAWGDCSL